MRSSRKKPASTSSWWETPSHDDLWLRLHASGNHGSADPAYQGGPKRSTQRFPIGDMPYMSYRSALRRPSATRVVSWRSAAATRSSSKAREVLDTIKAIIRATCRCGTLGLTPQSIAMLGGFKAQGRDAAAGCAPDRGRQAARGSRGLHDPGRGRAPGGRAKSSPSARKSHHRDGAGPHVDGSA